MYVAMGISAIAQLSRIVFMKVQQSMFVWKYFKEVVFIVISVLFLASGTTYAVHRLISYGNMRFIIVLAVSVISCIVFVYSIGITKAEKKAINTVITKKIKNK
jgi:predicted PurR-regulated permease PerM